MAWSRPWACRATELPTWDDIQFLTAQLHRPPGLDDDPGGIRCGDRSERAEAAAPEDPAFRLRHELRRAVGARQGGARPRRGTRRAPASVRAKAACCRRSAKRTIRYFYELAICSVRLFLGQAESASRRFTSRAARAPRPAPAGTCRATRSWARSPKCAALPKANPRVSPARFPGLDRTAAQIKEFADEVRDRTGGIPIGYKLSAQHIERDLDAALEVGVDYVILDGRGGGTGAAPIIFRDNISVPTIPALARARRHLDRLGRKDVTLVITGRPAGNRSRLRQGAGAWGPMP